MNALLNIELPTTYEGALLLGFQVVVIGVATVFAVLILIWGLLSLFKVFFGHGSAKEKKDEPTTAPAPVTPTVSGGDEIVAVIAAAIAMAESENCGCKFRVVSFRRK